MNQIPLNPVSHSTPLKQRTAREQQAAGVVLPYFAHDLDAPVNYHLQLAILQPEDLNRLVIQARAFAAKHIRNPLDPRAALAYPATEKEKVNFIRHTCLNRNSEFCLDKSSGYLNGYDNILNKIARGGVDVAARQKTFKLLVLRLIAESYPDLATECAHQVWLIEENT